MLEGLMTVRPTIALFSQRIIRSASSPRRPTPVEWVTRTAVHVEWDSYWASFAFHTARY